jgi:SOS-response transcriptional repressor LexA
MKGSLTIRQMEIYAFIRHYILVHGNSPTIRDMMKGLDISSTNGVRCAVDVLIKKEWILYPKKGTARGIVLIDDIWKHDEPSLRLIVAALGAHVNYSELNSSEMDLAHAIGASIREELTYAKKAPFSKRKRVEAGVNGE